MLDSGSWILGCGICFFSRGRCTLSRNCTRKQNSREIFPSAFFERSRFFGKHVYEPNFVQFFRDFQLAILLTVVMNLPQKMIVLIFGGDRSWAYLKKTCSGTTRI